MCCLSRLRSTPPYHRIPARLAEIRCVRALRCCCSCAARDLHPRSASLLARASSRPLQACGLQIGLLVSEGLEALLLRLIPTHGSSVPPDMPGGGSWSGVVSSEEGAATIAIFAKYLVLATFGVGVAPVVRDRVLGFKPRVEAKAG
jgi:hypothetical protein